MKMIISRANRNERGNIFTALLAAIALTGVVGVTTLNLLSGPISGMAGINKKTVAETQVRAIVRLAVMDAANQALVSPSTVPGDCDNDGMVEPMAARDSGTTQDYVPYALGAPVTDPWGSQYRYCVWDVGALRNDATCGAGAQRLAGTPNPVATGENARSQTVIAVFSAGPNKTADSTCSAYVNGTTAVFTKGSDDIAFSYSYTEAATATSSLWNLKSGAPGTAQIAKNLEMGTASVNATTGGATFSGLSSTGKILTTGGFQLASGVPATCTQAGVLRYNTVTSKVESCNGSAWVEVGGGSSGPTADITSNLAAHWRFNENGGTVANDSSGNSNTGTLTNSPAWSSSGADGGAVLFDGVDDYVSVSNSTSLNISGTAFSIAFWLNTPQQPIWSGAVTLAKPWDIGAGTAPYYQYAIDSSNYAVSFRYGNGTTLYDFKIANPQPNEWHHFAFTFNGTHVVGYRDGVEHLSVPQTATIVARGHPLLIGAVTTAGDNPYQGYLDDVRIYGRALSATDIAAVYAIGSAATGTGAGGTIVGSDDMTDLPTLNSEWTDSREGYIYFNKGGVSVGTSETLGIFNAASVSATDDLELRIGSFSAVAAQSAKFDFYHAAGTELAPANLIQHDSVGKIQVSGYNGGAFVPSFELGSGFGSTGISGRMDIKLATTSNVLESVFSVNEKGHVGLGGVSNASAGLEMVGSDPDLLIHGYTDTGADTKPSFVMRRARGNYTTPAAAQSGDVLGSLGFSGFDGDSTETTAVIAAKVTGTATSTTLPTDLIFYTGTQTIDLASASNERMRLSSLDRVGIGHNNPQNKLHVGGVLRVMDTGTTETLAINSSYNFYFNPSNTVFRLGQGGGVGDSFDPVNVAQRTWSSGASSTVNAIWSFAHGFNADVNTSYSYALGAESGAINGGVYSYALGNGSAAGWTIAGDYAAALGGYTSVSKTIVAATGDWGTVAGVDNAVTGAYSYVMGGVGNTVSGSNSFLLSLSNTANTLAQNNTMSIMGGNVGIGILAPANQLDVAGPARLSSGTAWTNTSDARLKNIDGDYERGLDDIAKLHTVRFRYKKDNPVSMPWDQNMIGFIAQEVQPVFPEAVHERPDGYLDFNIHSINVAMVNAVKELNDEQEAIAAERTELLARHAELTAELAALRHETDSLIEDMGLGSVVLGWLGRGGFVLAGALPFAFLLVRRRRSS